MNGKQVKLSLVDKTPGGFLIAGGSVAVDGGTAGTTRDIVFPLPSTAGAVALGRSCDGRVEWVSPEGSFGARESRGVEDEQAQCSEYRGGHVVWKHNIPRASPRCATGGFFRV